MVAPDPIAFSIFGIDIMWYGVLIGTGFLLAVAITYIRAPKFGIEQDFILTITIAVIPSAIIGARLYYVIFTWDMYKDDLMKIFDIRSGGPCHPRRPHTFFYRCLLSLQKTRGFFFKRH